MDPAKVNQPRNQNDTNILTPPATATASSRNDSLQELTNVKRELLSVPKEVNKKSRSIAWAVKKMLQQVNTITEDGNLVGKSWSRQRLIGGIIQGVKFPAVLGLIAAYSKFNELGLSATNLDAQNTYYICAAISIIGIMGIFGYTAIDAHRQTQLAKKMSNRLASVIGNKRVVEKGIALVQVDKLDAEAKMAENHEDRFNIDKTCQFIDGWYRSFQNSSQIALSLAVSGLVQPLLTIPIALTTIPILYGEKIKAAALKTNTANSSVIEKSIWPLRFAITDVRNLVEFYVISKFDFFLKRFADQTEKLADIKDEYHNFEAKIGKKIAHVNNYVTAGVGAAAFYLSFVHGTISHGELGTFLLSLYSMQTAVTGLSNEFGKMIVNKPFVESIFGQEQNSIDSETLTEEEIALLRKFEQGFTIHFRDVKVEVNKDDNSKKTILDISNLDIDSSEFIAIVGLKGSGKTTFVNTLLGLVKPSSGLIKVICKEDQSDYDLKDIPERVWKELFNYIPQSGYVGTSLSVNDFISGLGTDPVYTPRDSEQIKDRLALDQFVLKNPLGYEALLRMDTKFSGGEFALIRAAQELVRNRQCVMIGDEITANLDAVSESRLVSSIREMHKGMLILISHSMGFHGVNRIIVMNKGKIEAIGNEGTLIKESNTYQMLALGKLRRELTEQEARQVEIDPTNNTITMPRTIKGLKVRFAEQSNIDEVL